MRSLRLLGHPDPIISLDDGINARVVNHDLNYRASSAAASGSELANRSRARPKSLTGPETRSLRRGIWAAEGVPRLCVDGKPFSQNGEAQLKFFWRRDIKLASLSQ